MQRYSFHVLLLLFAIFVLTADWQLSEPQLLPPLKDGGLSDAQSKAIDILLSRSSLFANWSVAVVGGTVFVLREEMKRRHLNSFELVQVFIILTFSLISLFLTQSLPDILFRSLVLEQDALKNSGVYWYAKAIYLTFLLALLVFASLFFDALLRNNSVSKLEQ